MTNASNFVPAADAATLSQRCAASLRANGALIAAMLQDFQKEGLDAVSAVLAGGGSVGIETLVDGNAVNTIHLVAIEREGTRRVLATIAQPSQAQGKH